MAELPQRDENTIPARRATKPRPVASTRPARAMPKMPSTSAPIKTPDSRPVGR